jgi:hypothetical protein
MAIVVWVALGLALASQQTAASLGRPDLCGLIPGAVLPLLQSNPSCCQKKKAILVVVHVLPALSLIIANSRGSSGEAGMIPEGRSRMNREPRRDARGLEVVLRPAACAATGLFTCSWPRGTLLSDTGDVVLACAPGTSSYHASARILAWQRRAPVQPSPMPPCMFRSGARQRHSRRESPSGGHSYCSSLVHLSV